MTKAGRLIGDHVSRPRRAGLGNAIATKIGFLHPCVSVSGAHSLPRARTADDAKGDDDVAFGGTTPRGDARVACGGVSPRAPPRARGVSWTRVVRDDARLSFVRVPLRGARARRGPRPVSLRIPVVSRQRHAQGRRLRHDRRSRDAHPPRGRARPEQPSRQPRRSDRQGSRRSRPRLWQGKDRRSRPQRSEIPRRQLPPSRFRGRPDPAPAHPPQARLHQPQAPDLHAAQSVEAPAVDRTTVAWTRPRRLP